MQNTDCNRHLWEEKDEYSTIILSVNKLPYVQKGVAQITQYPGLVIIAGYHIQFQMATFAHKYGLGNIVLQRTRLRKSEFPNDKLSSVSVHFVPLTWPFKSICGTHKKRYDLSSKLH